MAVGYDSAINICTIGKTPADVAIIQIIINAIGIQARKSRLTKSGYCLTRKAKTANANIDIVNTISE